MNKTIQQQINNHLVSPIASISALKADHHAKVYHLTLHNQSLVIAKIDPRFFKQAITSPCPIVNEATMLRYLAKTTTLPVPTVLHAERGLILMTCLAGDHRITLKNDADLAKYLIMLHQHTHPDYGFDMDTVIGGLWQDNRPQTSWVDFFIHARLMAMAQKATAEKQLPIKTLACLEKNLALIASKLKEPAQPSLIHGDLWPGNILCGPNTITGFIDPALYYADREFELAYLAYFGPLSENFWQLYQQEHPLDDDFFNRRLPVYQLYPLLVSVILLQGQYLPLFQQALNAIIEP